MANATSKKQSNPRAEPQQIDLLPETMPPRQLDLFAYGDERIREMALRAMKGWHVAQRILGHTLH